MKKKRISLGFIGCGNMAKAIINGIIDKKVLPADEIGYFDPYVETIPKGIISFENNSSLVEGCRYIILAVKPNMVDQVLNEISKQIDAKPLGSIAAGITTEHISSIVPKAHILRIMPNTCANIGKSYTCLSKDNSLTEEEFNVFNSIFSAVGKVAIVKEDYFNVCAAVCSCGVAFGHMLIESMADGGVLCGMNKEKSIEMASYAIEGACSMIIASQQSPTALKDQICSPGGMTAKAMKALEDGGFRACVMSAVEAAYEKGKCIK